MEKMGKNTIPENRTVFLVRFPDGGIYATGSQSNIPGGPIAYLDREVNHP